MFTFVSENEKFTTLVAAAAGAHTTHAAAATAPAPATAPNTKYRKHFRWENIFPLTKTPRSMHVRKSIDAMYHPDSKRVFGLSPEELKEVGQRYGNLIDFMSKLERVMNLPPSPLPQDPLPAPSRAPTAPLTATAPPAEDAASTGLNANSTPDVLLLLTTMSDGTSFLSRARYGKDKAPLEGDIETR
ncbi:hypothetical protein B0H14DRAFT_3438271 [Mycena olivaceomarginata]|nr:hypothetical protein B0H14DRAFT_3438271 [Mycena olivaceomarginata]